MGEIFMLDMSIAKEIVKVLKEIDVRGYESMEKLVNTVAVIEFAMNPPSQNVLPSVNQNEEGV